MKKILYIAAIALIGLSSCSKDVLSPVPSNAISDEQIFSDVASAQTALNAGVAYIGNYMTFTLSSVMSDVMGEDALMTNGNYGIDTYNWNLYSYTYSQVPGEDPWWFGYANYIWEYDYKGIDIANNIIYYSESMPEGATKQNLLAQAHALRGFMYLRLIRLFAATYTSNPDGPGVILHKVPANAASEHIGRSSIKDTYALILEDLEYGRKNCSDANTYYFTPKSCALFMARAYLDMADYANAAKYASEAASGTFDGSNLMSQAEYQGGFYDPNGEWLMGFEFNQTTSNYYASLPSFYYLAKSAFSADEKGKANPSDLQYLDTEEEVNYFEEPLYGYSTVRFTTRFRNRFEDSDCRKLFPFYFYEEDGWFTSKFSHKDLFIGDADFPLARIAEAYLIKAECDAHTGGNAKSVLNALQTARGASPTDASLENIYIERRKELYGEGFRLQDIKRLHQSLDRSPDPEHWATVKTLPADSPRFMLPIPDVEMLYNKALTPADQNEFWRK
jgi:hypothetical protein